MPRFFNDFSLASFAKASLVSSMLLLGLGAAVEAGAQINPNPPASLAKPDEVTTNDSSLPLVYSVENSGATPGSVEGVSTSNGSPAWPSFADLPIIRPLPDPFLRVDGTRDTSFAAWEQRRQEILNGFETYMVGAKPDCSDCTVTATYTPPFAVGTTKYTLTINVVRNGKTTTLTSAITLPAGTPPANGWPFVMTVDGSGYTSAFPSASIATVPFTSSQVTSSDSPSTTDGFFRLYYPQLCDGSCSGLPAIPGYSSYNGNEGQFAAWAWGVSRLLDGVQIVANQTSTPLPLDMGHTAVTGCSYAGKIALFAGALDERIALTASEENGGGGVPSWRVSYNLDSEDYLGSHDGSVEDIDTTDHRWWCVQCMHSKFSSVDNYKMPVDLHEVAALVAPRALVQADNTNSYWLGSESNYVSSRAVQNVYNAFGVGDRFGFIIDGNHAHCSAPASEIASVAQFVDKYMLGESVSTDVEVYPDQPTDGYGSGQPAIGSYPEDFATMNDQRWTAWWGTDNPQFAQDWNSGGTTDLWSNNPITISTGDTVEAGYAIRMSAAGHPAATVKLPNSNIQTDVTCSDGSSYTLYIPLNPTTGLEATSSTYGVGQTYTIAAGNTSWHPSSSPTNSATYQGSVTVQAQVLANIGTTVNPGCADGSPGTAGRAYFVALGKQNGSNGDPAGPGFVTTDTTQSPLVVQFHLIDTTNGQGGAWSSPVTINQLPIN
ncbi:MAG: hypothetical protein ACRD3N_15075 [Terracidiphilus sp.]